MNSPVQQWNFSLTAINRFGGVQFHYISATSRFHVWKSSTKLQLKISGKSYKVEISHTTVPVLQYQFWLRWCLYSARHSVATHMGFCFHRTIMLFWMPLPFNWCPFSEFSWDYMALLSWICGTVQYGCWHISVEASYRFSLLQYAYVRNVQTSTRTNKVYNNILFKPTQSLLQDIWKTWTCHAAW